MCGIAGILNFNGELVSPKTIDRMNKLLAHRGPDGEGIWTENFGLGHRRLSIIDLSDDACQPMISENERYVLTYNGECYNYRELRIKLTKFGYRFRSTSDTEVVLNALIHWGDDAIEKFNGMFALAFYDRLTGDLLLARDRYGIKPLYYFSDTKTFIFASEQKAIVPFTNAKATLDYQGLVEYLTFQNIFTNRTLQKNVRLLEPGHILKIKQNEKSIQRQQYWDFNFSNKQNGDVRELEEEVARLFELAVERQLASDVEIGCYLSGGMDSGSIAAIASKNLNGLKTFTCGFDLSSANGIELGFDERREAEAISNYIKSEQYEMVLKSGDMERCLTDLVMAIEEPRVGQSYPNYYAAKLTSKFVKVVMSGAGGDELFAGYPWRYFQTFGAQNLTEYTEHYYKYWQRMLNRQEVLRLCGPIKNEVEHIDTLQIFRSFFNDEDNSIFDFEQNINHSLYFEAKTFLHGLLVVEDKLSMAHSLETRLPFLDNDLVDYSMTLGASHKIKSSGSTQYIDENDLEQKLSNLHKKTNDGKIILRSAMKNYLPERVTQNIKKGFSGPDGSWFKGESINFVKKLLTPKSAAIYEFFDYKYVNKLLDEHFAGVRNRRLLVWSFINLNEYIEKNL